MNVIWLNGTSSSGKTTIAKLLQVELSETFLCVSIDAFTDMLPTRVSESSQALGRAIEPVVRGFHGALLALADAENKLIIDHVLREPGWLSECVHLFTRHSVLFVGVHCRPETLEARERMRGDRDLGQALWQLPRVHAHRVYDIEVDTSAQSPEECARLILAAFANPPQPSAFERLRTSLSVPANLTVNSDAGKSGARGSP